MSTEDNHNPCEISCPHEYPEWKISAGVLNALWSDILPRLAAKYWQDPAFAMSLDIAAGEPDALIPIADLIVDIAEPVQGTPDRGLTGTPKFQSERIAVLAHLQNADSSPIPPMRFIPGGGFDYVISDWGIDFFIPNKPLGVVEMLRYYQFRETGRAAIGLPFYGLGAEGSPPSEVTVPTGPSQTWIDPDYILALVQASGQLDEACYVEMEKGVNMAAKKSDEVYKRQIYDYLKDENNHPISRADVIRLERLAELETVLGPDTVKCLLDPVRCWAISGAVFRGVQAELPRIVANIWFEEAIGIDGQSGTYSDMINPPDGEGLRQILRQRMETSLPHSGQMHIEFGAPSQDPDIWITKRGLQFPHIPTLVAVAGAGPQALTAILGEVAQGRAGNVVFTSSQRTD